MLEDKIDFNDFLSGTLAQEVRLNQPAYNILRRRIAIVLGQWVPVKDGLNRPLVYQIFQHLLEKQDPLNDLVVRITAGRQLRNIILPFEFTIDGFQPCCAPIISHLMALIAEVELSETKLTLLNTLSTLVQSLEDKVSHEPAQVRNNGRLTNIRLPHSRIKSLLFCLLYGNNQATSS